ncbi:glycoside hydrolase family 3 N-terminal domain-containing protein [Seleniivibrio woodruffii]|uniref:beta-N-acetylhexosaminidase n=2 Tax=Seleniivibrio woodruffii TaxID=1078050 RepID=A0A4R1K2U3_9BACT|nr:glycoside hydrolase family 3 protein [Seleniivibrio woodruffii]TCK58368.1 beta-N-acetylhexosaminidase [Seleniivibrio woodruffii]TVZ36742.1 beta-N-acetylhexosaminidase [Seleniivibrio woodruffii]
MKKLIITAILMLSAIYGAFADMPAIDKNIVSKRMVMVGFHATDYKDEELKELKQQIENGLVAGVVFYGYNIESRRQVKRLIAELNSHNRSFVPLMMAVDEEGGRVQRLTVDKGFVEEPTAQYIARHMTPDQAEKVYELTARDLADVGFNVNFAPVIDLNINPASPIIGGIERSYSSNVDTVVAYAKAFINAHRKYGVITCLKHFPGHGSSKKDSHQGFTDVTDTWNDIELEPFQRLISDGYADMIMTAHVFNGGIDPDYPATLSKKTISLLQDMGYKGIIISDDLQMGAIADNYSFEDTVKLAVGAGNNILLFSNYFFYEKRYPEKVRQVLGIQVN